MSYFTEWLNQKIQEKGWSQSETARRGEISASMISLILEEKSKPGIRAAQGIARAFKIPVEEVYRLAGIWPRRSADRSIAYHVGGPEDRDRLLAAWDAMDVTDRERLLDIAERLAGIDHPRIIGVEDPNEEA